MASSFNLSGRVVLEGGSAMATAAALEKRLEGMAKGGRATSASMKETAQAVEIATRAFKNEATALATLTVAQQKANDVQRQGLANARAIKAESAAKVNATNLLAQTREQILLDDAALKGIIAQEAAEGRLNTERLRGLEIESRTSNARTVAASRSAVLAGQEVLVQNRAITESVKQRIAVEDAEGRAAVRNAQVASAANRSRIAQENLALKKWQLNQAAMAKAASPLSLNAERSATAIGRVGSAATHAGVLGTAAFVGLAANAAIMQTEFSKVIRTSDILDKSTSQLNAEGFKNQDAAVASLRLQFDALAQALPLTYKELTEIGAAANQLGIPSADLASFTKTVAEFSITTGVSVDTASTAFGRLDSLITNVVRNGKEVGGVNHNYQALADAINKVGVNSVATDQQIINIASQISGIANAAGLGYKEIIGFSGALASVSVSPYLARGLTTRLFTNIGNSVNKGGVELQKFSDVAGLSAKEFADAWKNDPSKALEYLFDGIRSSGGDAVNVLKSLGVSSVLDQPAIIRMANAADKFGKTANAAAHSGGLLRQTMDDAATSAGTGARQYAVMSNTVGARFQVALNRVQVLLRNIGESNLGPLGDALKFIGDQAIHLNNSLKKPVELLGLFKLQFTNGELLGAAAVMTGIVGATLLAVGAGAKLVQTFLHIRMGITALKGGIASASAAFAEYAAGAGSAAAANEVLAASEKNVGRFNNLGALGAGKTGKSAFAISGLTSQVERLYSGLTDARFAASRLTSETSMFGAKGGRVYQAYTAQVDKLLNSSNGLANQLGIVGTKGTVGLQRVSAASSRVTASLKRAGSGALGFAKAIGPATLVVGGLIAVATWVGDIRAKEDAAGTSAGRLAQALAGATDQAKLLSTINVGKAVGFMALGGIATQKFAASAKELNANLTAVGDNSPWHNFVATTFQNKGPTIQKTTDGLKKMGEALDNLNNSGGIDQGIAGLQAFFKGVSGPNILSGLNNMGDATDILTQRLAENGIQVSADGHELIQLVQGTLKFNDASSKAAALQQTLTGAFNGNATAATEYLDAVKGAASASVDLNTAFKNVDKKSSNPFGDFIKNAKKAYHDFATSQENALKIAQDTGVSMTLLSQLDPGILAGAVKGGLKNEKKLAEVMALPDAKDAFLGAVGTLQNNPKLLSAFTSLGQTGMDNFTKSLADNGSIEDAFRAAGQKGVDAYNKAIAGTDAQPITLHPTVTVDPKTLNLTALKDISAKISIKGDPAPAIKDGEDAATALSKLQAYIKTHADTIAAVTDGKNAAATISALKAALTVQGVTAPAQQAGESTAAYIGGLEALLQISANPALAHRTADEAKAVIDSMVAQLKIDGDAQPATQKGEDAAASISRLAARMIIDADPNPAHRTAAQEQSAISSLRSTITVLGDTAPARGAGEGASHYIDRLKGTITALANTGAARSATDSATEYINSKVGKIVVAAATAAAEAAIDYAARDRTVTLFTKGGGGSFATGGPIYGPGSGTSDSIPAMLSNGEYVIRAKQAARYRSLLDNINYRGVAHFASGGVVAQGSAKYEGAATTSHSRAQAHSSQFQVTELSSYDRHLLQSIVDNIGVVIAPTAIANATSNTYRGQARRGNG